MFYINIKIHVDFLYQIKLMIFLKIKYFEKTILNYYNSNFSVKYLATCFGSTGLMIRCPRCDFITGTKEPKYTNNS